MEISCVKNRVVGLDLMKGLGLYMVVLYHLVYHAPLDVLGGGVRDLVRYGLCTGLSICVPLFFTASGALALNRPMDLRRNLRRCAHLVVLTAFWMAVSLGVVLALRREWPGVRGCWDIAKNLKVGYIQHLWYLPAFLFLTLLMPLLHRLGQEERSLWRYGMGLVLVLTFGNGLLNDGEYLLRWVLGRAGRTGTRQFFWYTNFFSGHYWYAVVYAALGGMLLRQDLGRFRKAAWVTIPVAMAGLTVFGLAKSHVMGSMFDPVFNNYGDPLTLALTAAVSVLLLTARPGPWVQKAAASLGRCSLGIYLIHWLVIEFLIDYLPTAAKTLMPVTALAVLLLSWGLTWCLLRVPVVQNLFTAAPAWVGRRQTNFQWNKADAQT